MSTREVAADTSIRKHLTFLTLGRLLGTTDAYESLGSSPDAGYSITADTDYVGVFSVTRTGADTVDITSSLSLAGGGLLDSHTESDTSGAIGGLPIASTFGMLAFHANSSTFGSSRTAGEADNGIDFTNVMIEYLVPEPSVFSLLLIALISSRGMFGRK